MAKAAFRTQRAQPHPALEPMMEINTTPLIDVMLVLLIMLIITIPPQTHRVRIDLPQGPPPAKILLKNDLILDRSGALTWNGNAVTDSEASSLLFAAAAADPSPEVHFRADPETRYARVDDMLAIVNRSGLKQFGMVGNEQYATVF